MDSISAWTGYPILPAPALQFQQFREGDQRILTMLYYHFFPPLCFFANRLMNNEEAAKQIAENSLRLLWGNRSGMKDWEAIKIFLYLNTYQQCSQFIKTTQNISSPLKTPGKGLAVSEETVLSLIVQAELFNYLEEMAGAPEWLTNRLTSLSGTSGDQFNPKQK